MASRRKTPLQIDIVEPHACTIDLRLEILSRLPFFEGLTAEEIAQINRHFREEGFQPGEYVYYAGDPARHLQVIATGRVKLVRHNLSGKNVLLDILTPGEFFGSLSPAEDQTYAETAQALTMTCVLRLETAAFRILLERYPAVAVKVLDITARRLQEAQERVRQLSVNSVERRLAYTLLKLGEKLGQAGEMGLLIQTPLARDDLAEMTGSTTETISRVMSQFQKEGWIQSGRQWVAITHLEALRAAAAEEIE